MKLADLSHDTYQDWMAQRGVVLQMGPFTIKIKSRISYVTEGIWNLYRDFPCLENGDFADFHIEIRQPYNLRRWFRPQVVFVFDDHIPFKPLPLSDAFALFEWGLNWCVANFAHRYLMIHAAVCEKNGKAVIMPAPPGSGKSTLCAALSLRGWRLLSDELTLIDLQHQRAIPVPRPVSLKNESIDVIKKFEPDVFIGRPAVDTTKGTVAHMRPPRESVLRANELATPAWVILPQYKAGSPTHMLSNDKARSFMWLAENSFNYSVLGGDGFRRVAELVDHCDCFHFSYSDLDSAIDAFNDMASDG